jgi:hypothetical protein
MHYLVAISYSSSFSISIIGATVVVSWPQVQESPRTLRPRLSADAEA